MGHMITALPIVLHVPMRSTSTKEAILWPVVLSCTPSESFGHHLGAVLWADMLNWSVLQARIQIFPAVFCFVCFGGTQTPVFSLLLSSFSRSPPCFCPLILSLSPATFSFLLPSLYVTQASFELTTYSRLVQIHCASYLDLDLMILLSWASEYWEYSYVPSCLAHDSIFTVLVFRSMCQLKISSLQILFSLHKEFY